MGFAHSWSGPIRSVVGLGLAHESWSHRINSLLLEQTRLPRVESVILLIEVKIRSLEVRSSNPRGSGKRVSLPMD